MTKRAYIAVLLALLFPLCTWANNLQLTHLGLQDRDALTITISWDNAWNLTNQAPNNHDAVWLFVKVKEDGEWKTAVLSNVDGDSEALEAGRVRTKAVSDGMGLIVRPGFEGAGNVEATELRLALDAPLGEGVTEVLVFGIEMVWVNEGPFWLGDGSSENTLRPAGASGPYYVGDDGEIPVGANAGELDSTDTYAPKRDIPANWPEGYNGFYCMKYEISQGQYVDFLNTLTADQQSNRTVCGPSAAPNTHALTTGPSFRNGIRVFTSGTSTTPAVFACDGNEDGQFDGPADGENRACNFLNWDDLLSYLCWSGLSPMTEFEFEKVCRGPEMPVALEFAWGTDAVEDANTVLLDGEAGEAVAESPVAPMGLASHGYSGPQGPLRCGFGGRATSTRLSAGAGYYGVMELSGNLWEMCMAANWDGIAFTGSNGIGILALDGKWIAGDWTWEYGGIYRGGGWNSGILPGFRDLAVSDRFYAGQAPGNRRNTVGGRGVRR